MENRIRFCVEELFKSAPQTFEVMTKREELIDRLIAKYRKLTGEGKSEEDAFNEVSEDAKNAVLIFSDVPAGNKHAEAPKKKDTLHESYKSSVISLIWLLSVTLYFLISFTTSAWDITWILFVFTAAVTNGVSAAFRWKAQGMHAARGFFQGMLWCAATAVYLIISFATSAWYVTWIIFLIAAALSQVLRLLFEIYDNRKEANK